MYKKILIANNQMTNRKTKTIFLSFYYMNLDFEEFYYNMLGITNNHKDHRKISTRKHFSPPFSPKTWIIHQHPKNNKYRIFN